MVQNLEKVRNQRPSSEVATESKFSHQVLRPKNAEFNPNNRMPQGIGVPFVIPAPFATKIKTLFTGDAKI